MAERRLTMKYIVEISISIIILILIVLAVGYIYRKKLYKEVARLEAKKMELMNRPVVDELSKVKRLNMTGETEVLFERWKSNWDEIVTVKMPNIDELLFDAEEAMDKYRFNQSKSIHIKIEMLIDEIGVQIDEMLEELGELIGSEESNREQMEDVLEKHHLAKKQLIAHRHTFGKTVDKLDECLDYITKEIKAYESLTNQGDYLIARQKVLSLVEDVNILNVKFEKIPNLIVQCHTVIPNQLSDLYNGYKEMLGQGFTLDHLQVEQFHTESQEKLENLTKQLENTEVQVVEEGIEELFSQIDKMFDDLEAEVYERHYVINENERIGQLIEQLTTDHEKIFEEIEVVKNSYQLKEEDIRSTRELEKMLTELSEQFDLLTIKISEETTAYSILSAELKKIDEQLQIISEQHTEFTEHLLTLRKDELEASEQIERLSKRMNEILRTVRMSKIPGMPMEFDEYMEQAKQRVLTVRNRLEEKPLEMDTVKKELDEATDSVDYLHTKTEEYIDDAHLAEHVIQYGNRYRAHHAELRESLNKAERLFRNYNYKDALEEAAVAVEQIEPGALKKIEQYINNENDK